MALFFGKPKKKTRKRRATTKSRRTGRRKRSYKRTSTRSRKKTLDSVKTAIVVVVAIIIAVIALLGFSAFKFIHAPFTSASNVDLTDTELVWGEESTNIAIIKVDDIDDRYSAVNKLLLAHFDENTKRYAIYYIPVNEEIEYAKNYGSGPFSRAYAVGNADEDRGVYLIEKTILKQLAVHIDGYVLIDNEGFDEITGLIGDINNEDLSASFRLKNMTKMPDLIKTFREVVVTNLKLADIWSAIKFIRQTSETSSSVIELNRYQLIDTDNWDDLWESKLNVSNIKKEAVKVFIANASSEPRIPGLAGWGGRVVENLGGSVLDLQNAFADYEEEMIITEDIELETVKQLSEATGISKVIHINDLDDTTMHNPQIFRTEVTLILKNF